MLFYVLKLRPQAVVSTGTHTAVVFAYLAKLLLRSKILYVETYANVKKANVSGKLIHPIADLYLVQWESLLPAYKKAQYVGKLF
jgi:beta-1,4-N-acetylglucosaminyltransferase